MSGLKPGPTALRPVTLWEFEQQVTPDAHERYPNGTTREARHKGEPLVLSIVKGLLPPNHHNTKRVRQNRRTQAWIRRRRLRPGTVFRSDHIHAIAARVIGHGAPALLCRYITKRLIPVLGINHGDRTVAVRT